MRKIRNIYRDFLWKFFKKIEYKRHELKAIFWETTLRCNLMCSHCGSNCGPNVKADELSTDEIKQVIVNISKDFQPNRIMFYITGGEPLLREDLFEVTELISNLGFSWGMVTNGTLVNEKTVKECKRTKMSTVSVSIDGLKEHHEKIRGKGTFEKAINSVKLFHSENFVKVLEITSCINKENINHLNEMYNFFSSLNIDIWRLIATSPIGRSKNNKNILLDGNEYKTLLDFIKEKRKLKQKLIVTFCDEGFLGNEYEELVRDHFYYCGAGVNIASILSNGDIASCPSIPRNLIEGNVRKDNFKEIWENGFKKYRNRSWMKQGECINCKHWAICEGNSIHLWDFENNKTQLCHVKLLSK